MPDIIQESYEVLNHFLGETNNRNLKRLPEKYEPFLRAVENLVQYAFLFGKAEGQRVTSKEVCELFKRFQQEVKYPKYERLGAEEEKK